MRVYLTHCSAEKDSHLKETGKAVTPDLLYTDAKLCQFMERCQQKNVRWAILSDLYGIYQSDDCRVWYEKHPDTVTPQEEEIIIQDCDSKLEGYDEIYFSLGRNLFIHFMKRSCKEQRLLIESNFFRILAVSSKISLCFKLKALIPD